MDIKFDWIGSLIFFFKGGMDNCLACSDLHELSTRDIRTAMRVMRGQMKLHCGSVLLHETVKGVPHPKPVPAFAVCCKLLVDDHERRRVRKRKVE